MSIEKVIVDLGSEKYQQLMQDYDNKKLHELVTNKRELDKILNINNKLVRMDHHVFDDPKGVPFFDSHFYSPYKYIYSRKVSTFSANIIILWLMSVFFFITLYFDVFKKMLSIFSFLSKKEFKKKAL